MAWQTLKVGGGGYVTGISIANDGTMVGRTDTNGAYLWTGSQWQQLVTASSMPAAFDFTGDGVYEIQVAPSNSNVMYMTFAGYVFKSTNKGTTWTQTSFTPFNNSGDPANNSYRFNGQKMAIDPSNPNIVYVGTPSSGLFVSTNGGATWSSVSAIPAAAGQGITGIEFDPAVGGAVGGVTQTIFASSYGHGVYKSTNGGATWTALSGGPTDVEAAAVSSTGVYYAAGNSGSGLWSYANGAWKQLISGNNGGQGIQAVTVNPSNPNEIVAVAASGYLNISYDAGATWTGPMWNSNEVTSADVPWLAQAQQVSGGNYLSVGGAAFNPANPSQMLVTGGTGVWTTTQVPTSGATWSTPVIWNSQTAGIENLVANGIIVPPGGNPVLASWDRPFFEITNPNAYPSTYGPVNSDTIVAGWSVDYASSTPSFLVGIADWGSTEESGYSTNGGQTWTKFSSELSGVEGGTIAASTPQNIIWAPAGSHQPYYTLNGGSSWNAINLPGVSSWGGFDSSAFLVQRSVTADRVQANTFYLYDPGKGVFETTNGGQNWTNVHPGYIESNSSLSGFNSSIQSVPGEAGDLFYTSGPQGTPSATPVNSPFYRSTDGGATWTAVPNVLDVFSFGYGAAAPGQSYPAIYIVGYVNSVYGIWQSTNNSQSWTNIGGASMPNGLDWIDSISGDPNHFGQVYVGFHGGGYAYLPAGSTGTTTGGGGTTTGGGGTTTGGAGTAPTITGLVESPATGDLNAGKTVVLTLTFSEAVTVVGTPTLALNDGGTATYTSGAGTNALTFNYTVLAGQNTPDLMVTALNLPTGAKIADASGNAANLSLSSVIQSSPQIDTAAPGAPVISSGAVSGAAVTLKGTAEANSTVTVFDNSTKLGTTTTNSSGAWTYTTGPLGSGSQSFTATATDGAANVSASSKSLVVAPTSSAAPTITGISDSPATSDLKAGKTVTLTLTFSKAVTVAGAKPTLSLNDGGTATYVRGSGTSALTFNYTVMPGQNTAGLMVTAVNLPTVATIKDSAGNAASLSLAGRTQTGPMIDTTAPTITGISESPATGDLNAGKTVTLTLTFSEAVTVAGKPTLTLNDRGTATYVGGSGTKALTFSYTVAAGAGQNIAALAVSALNLPTGVTIKDGGGNAVNQSLAGLKQTGPQVDTTTPTVTSLVASPGTGTQFPGDVVTITINMSEAVTVTGSAPTLVLNDGGSATYTGGSGTKALTFKYTVKSTDRDVSTLAISAIKLPAGTTILDGAGNAANMTGTVHSFVGLAVDPPVVTTQTKAGGSYEVTYADLMGLSYSSYEDIFNSAGIQVAEARDLLGGDGTLVLSADRLLVSSSSGSLGVTIGSDAFKIKSHANESIVASGHGAETFQLGSGFGHESITGLLTSGASHDVIELPLTMFKGVSSTNTAPQNWNALLSSGAAVQTGANVTITDAARDTLTLNSMTISTLSHDAGSVFKFA
jgi:Bacterial Ig domain